MRSGIGLGCVSDVAALDVSDNEKALFTGKVDGLLVRFNTMRAESLVECDLKFYYTNMRGDDIQKAVIEFKYSASGPPEVPSVTLKILSLYLRWKQVELRVQPHHCRATLLL
jgi:hypothetical protein